jgi:type II secretory pathway component PulF
VIALAAAWRLLGPRGRWMLDGLLLRLPILGAIVHQSEVARFARSFGLQIDQGIPILQAIEVAIQVVGHTGIRAQLERLPEGLRQGSTLSSGLKALAIGTPFLVNTVAVGEESGKVGEALMEVAGYYERETERLLQVMATLLEPMLIVVVGLIVGFIVMAVLLPIFDMSAVNL